MEITRKLKMKKPKYKLFNWLVNLSVFVMILTGLTFLFLAFAPIDVLKNWKVEVVEKPPFVLGQTITIQSVYTKVRDVTGTAYRYVECKNADGIYVRYPISAAEANHNPGPGGTAVTVKLPDALPTTPESCHITISVEYTIYTFRKFHEYQKSAEFTVIAPAADGTSTTTTNTNTNTTTTTTNNSVVTPPLTSSNGVATPSNTPAQTPPTPSGGSSQPVPEDSQPTGVRGVVNSVLNTVRNLF